jgi:hydrogenase-4 component B
MSGTGAILFAVSAGLWVAAAAAAGLISGEWRVRCAAILSGAGGVCALTAAILVALTGTVTEVSLTNGVVGGASFRDDPLSSVFCALLGVVAIAIALYIPRYHRSALGTGIYLAAYNLALVASLAVLLANSATTFLVAWESMSLFCYLLILRNHRQEGVTRGAFLFLALGEVGFVLIIAAFAILATQTGSLDFTTIATHAGGISAGWRSAAFVLALLGFGFKAGIVPLHIWLPEAHPIAPADGSAFLSGLVIKLGVYGIALFGFRLVIGGPAWWGVLTMSLGAVSAVIGILYALMERDLKRFLAYSSIENIGIIVTALGASLTFFAYGQSPLGTFLLLVALYHVLNHGIYKALLFLEAGVIEHATGTRNMDLLGGLIRGMPRAAAVSLVGTMAIAALPPFSGFVSEWLLFQGLFQGFRIPDHAIGIVIVVAGALIALTSGLAVNAFVRSFGIPFLGMPRTQKAAVATEERQPVLGPGLLAVLCVFLGIGAPLVLVALERITHAVTGVGILPTLVVGNLTIIPAHTDFSGFSPTYLAACLVGMIAVPLLIYAARRPVARGRSVPVWDGGVLRFKARMQYTATTHANPVRVTFGPLYRPSVEITRASDDPAGRSGPVHYGFKVTPLFERFLYKPVVTAVQCLAQFVRPLQSGDVNLYLLYVFVAILIAYFAYSR